MQMMWNLVHSSWILHISCNKRRVAPIAALLSAVLHHSVFSEEGMHEIDNNAAGPLKWVCDYSLSLFAAILSEKSYSKALLTLPPIFNMKSDFPLFT